MLNVRRRTESTLNTQHSTFPVPSRGMNDDDHFRGWTRPGPRPPGGVAVEGGESLDCISGRFGILQLTKGHRFSTDDVLTAWYATQWARREERAEDLGSGIGAVGPVVAWRLPGARI